MTVYVRWYGKVLEGELLEGETMGMKQVRIPLDGHHPVALFTPEHVYESVEKMQGVTKESYSDTAPSPSDVLPADDRESIEAFKRDNWDAERGHLRIDSLDQFYKLWREAMTPFGYVEQGGRNMDSDEITARPQRDYGSQPMSRNAVKQSPQRIVSDERMEELRTQLKKSLKPVKATQLLLFD